MTQVKTELKEEQEENRHLYSKLHLCNYLPRNFCVFLIREIIINNHQIKTKSSTPKM